MVDRAIVETRIGKVRGHAQGGVHAFLGIPYAAATTGAARFRPPQPVAPWAGIREALAYGPRAPQNDSAFGLAPEIGRLMTPAPPQPVGEDCLVLNLWTAGLRDGGRRPVLVWLHGGGFIAGSGADPWTHGARLAPRQDVVVVTLNHRLGALGYLHLEEVAGADFAGAGLAGMFDIVAALTWIRDNIAEFGGDPGNITLVGQSGGGAKVCTLMAMPRAQELFHKAVVQSGPALRMADGNDGTATALAFLEELQLRPEQAARLRDLPLPQLLLAQERVVARASLASFAERRRTGFNPVSGPADFPAGPFDGSAPPLAADIPLLIGVTRHEMSIFYALEPWLADLDDIELGRRLVPYVGTHTDALVREYRRLYPAATAGDLFIQIVGDQGIVLPSLRIADLKAAQAGAPVFTYLFLREAPALNGQLRSCHIMDVPYVFDTLADAPFAGRSPEDTRLAETMSTAWVEFARSGVPRARNLPEWRRYSEEDRSTMLLDAESRLVNDPFLDIRSAWTRASTVGDGVKKPE